MIFVDRNKQSGKYYTIKLYVYGTLKQTLTCEEGSSVTLPSISSEYSDDTFYGWSTSSNSATRTYTANASITPTADMNLYAIYSYTTSTRTIGIKSTAQYISNVEVNKTYSVSASDATGTSSCSITFAGLSGGTWTYSTSHSGNYVSGTAKCTSLGSNTKLYGPLVLTYEGYTTTITTNYRVSSHS